VLFRILPGWDRVAALGQLQVACRARLKLLPRLVVLRSKSRIKELTTRFSASG
jgi:hypothetical protein